MPTICDCVCCLFRERRFFIVLGFVYATSIISLLRQTTDINDRIRGEVKQQGEVRVGGPRIQPKPRLRAVVGPVSNSTCDRLPGPTYLEPGRLPLTALSSFPGSGNTWMRVLLSSLTGINTGDIYKDRFFKETPGFTFRKDDTVIAVKTHHPFWDDSNGPDPSAPENRYWERAIVIVRHPLDATISGFSFFKTKGSHTKTATMDKFLKADGSPTGSWNKWAHDQIRNWGRCLEYWVNVFRGPVHIVFYENLKQNLSQELIDVNEFLGLPLDPVRLDCILKSHKKQTKFKRGQTIDKRLVYDESMLNEVEVMLDKTKYLLTANYTHHSNLFHWPDSYSPSLVRENFSLKPV